MKITRSWLVRFLSVSVMTFAAYAANAGETPDADKDGHRTAVLKEFDADGDGKLSRDERVKARKTRGERQRLEMLKKFDADGDGKLTGDERTAARELRDEHREARKRRKGAKRRDRGAEQSESGDDSGSGKHADEGEQEGGAENVAP